MKHYSVSYQQTHDIDWFFKIRSFCFHAASNGGPIPSFIDKDNNRVIQHLVHTIEGEMYPSQFSPNVIRDGSFQDLNLESFAEFASKGFISLDRIDDNSTEFPFSYQVIAFPTDPNNSPPQSIINLLPEVKEPTMLSYFHQLVQSVYEEKCYNIVSR